MNMLMQIRDSRNNGTLITSGLKWACCYPPSPQSGNKTHGNKRADDFNATLGNNRSCSMLTNQMDSRSG